MTNPGIFFEGVDIYGLSEGDSYWNATVRDICAALGKANIPCSPLNLQDHEYSTFSFDTSALPPFAIAWNFNNGRWALYEGRQVRMTSILPVKIIGLLWDHPFHWTETILEMREFDERVGRPPFHIGVMDRGHVDYLTAMGLARDQIFEWRQAGPTAIEVPPMTDRTVDFVFHGTINEVEGFDDFCQRLEITDGAVARGLQDCIAAIIEEPIDVYAAVLRHIVNPCGMDPSVLTTAQLCREIDRLTRDIRRVALLGGLRNLEIHYIGNVNKAFQAANPKGVFLGALPFGEIVTYLQNTKVALYDTINFRDAAVMRLFYSIQQGCAPAAEMNTYLEQEFVNGESILALNLRDPADNTARLQDAVTADDTLQRLADRARALCTERHTWDQRIAPLANAIRS